MSAALDVAARGAARSGASGSLARLRTGARSATVWVVAALVVLLATIVGFLLSTGTEETRPLHWDATGPEGGRAFVEVLRDQGVTVTTTESVTEARSLAGEPGTTVLVFDPEAHLDPAVQQDISRAVENAGNPLVLIEPDTAVEEYSAGIIPAYQAVDVDAPNTDDPMPPDCDWEAAQRAGTVSGAIGRYSSTGLSPGEVTVCYHHPWDQAGYGAVAREETATHTLTVLGDRTWLSNDGFDQLGNAALTLGALGTADRLVYLHPEAPPILADGDSGSPFLLVPSWFWVAFLWLIPLGLAAMLWRGRRLGPLAVERLPVVVPALETVIGRAGILQRSGARSAALGTLRTAALVRLARRLALPSHARTDDICLALAARTGADPAEVHWLFVDAVPTTDAQLTDIAARIAALESEVSRP